MPVPPIYHNRRVWVSQPPGMGTTTAGYGCHNRRVWVVHLHSYSFTGNATISCKMLTAVSTFGTSFTTIERFPF